jgi:hypothetical protein
MGVELTVRQKILVASAALGDESEAFSVEDLIVRTWNLFPESFSLRGYFAKHPDSNRVLAKLSGADGLCGLGWLEHTDQRMYRMTRKGRTVAKQLQAIASGIGASPSLVAANEGEEALAEAAAQAAKTAVKIAEPKPVRTPTKRAEKKTEKVVAKPELRIDENEIFMMATIAKSEALRKFLRGSPLTFADACQFWNISPSRPAGVREKLEIVEELLKRVVESFGAEGPSDPRLPPLSTCYGLLNLHRLMSGRYSREIEALKVQLATG